MNQSRNTGDSLYIGGPNGTGRTFFNLHDATFNPSSGYKHVDHFHQFLIYLSRSRNRGVDK